MRRALLILLASLSACRRAAPPAPKAERVYNYAFTHAPIGKPCAPGYQFRARFFTERDGTHQDACVLAPGLRAELTLDELKPGESIELSIGGTWVVRQ